MGKNVYKTLTLEPHGHLFIQGKVGVVLGWNGHICMQDPIPLPGLVKPPESLQAYISKRASVDLSFGEQEAYVEAGKTSLLICPEFSDTWPTHSTNSLCWQHALDWQGIKLDC